MLISNGHSYWHSNTNVAAGVVSNSIFFVYTINTFWVLTDRTGFKLLLKLHVRHQGSQHPLTTPPSIKHTLADLWSSWKSSSSKYFVILRAFELPWKTARQPTFKLSYPDIICISACKYNHGAIPNMEPRLAIAIYSQSFYCFHSSI